MTTGIDMGMNTNFYAYLLKALPTADLVEVSELFPRHQINQIFIKEIDQLIRQRLNDPEDLRELRAMDLVSYIDAAVRRSGFQEHDRDELVQEIVTKLLVGNFFRGWRGGSIVARFKTSVRNHIATLAVRRSRYRRRSGELPGDVPARKQDVHDLVHDFRAWLRLRYGVTAQQAFDHRLAGGDSKELIGIPGIETSYKLKKIVQQIKEAAREYGSRDPDFLSMVERAFAEESETIKKRFKAVSR